MHPTIATPLVPHSINVSWSMPFGYGAQLADTPNFDPGPGAYGFKLYPYPNIPPGDPFAIDRRSGRCGPEAVAGRTKYLGIVRQYVQGVDAIRDTTGSYPMSFPDADVQGLHMYYRRNGDGFARSRDTPNISMRYGGAESKPTTCKSRGCVKCSKS
ncbi:MAG: hypothetical protein ACXWNK_07820 [Vulcanimicrobiaceae bacterium]